MEYRYRIQDVADYFLSKSDKITPKKLQKLLYFAYSWYLAMMNEHRDKIDIKLFNTEFEAWIHGPVSPEIYDRYRCYGANEIPKYLGELKFQDEDFEILEDIWGVYGEYNANQLESISHQHTPWKLTREKAGCSYNDWCCETIDDKVIFDYYVEQLVS